MRHLAVGLLLFCCLGLVAPGVQAQAADEVEALAPENAGAPVAVPPATEQAMRYYHTGNAIWVFNIAWSFAIPLLFLFTGFSARIRDWAARLGRKWFFIIGAYIIIYSLINFIIELPIGYALGFQRQHAYGLSNQTFGKWIGDSFKGLGVGLAMGVLFLWVPYLLLKKSPGRWWLYTGLLSMPFIFLLMLISPIWISPLFNDFGPMKDQALEAEILALADRAGIEGGRVFEVDKSVDTKTINAYVTGFLDTKRIVLWDTILEKLDQDELLYVMGHEMGHYALGHVPRFVLFLCAGNLIVLYIVYRVAGGLIRKYQHRFGFSELADIASLPLLIVLSNAVSLLGLPIPLAYSRHNEREADRFALELLQTNQAAATAFIKLQEENLGNPRPGALYMFLRAGHPSIGQRVDFINTYRPWESGAPLKYEAYFATQDAPGDAPGDAP